MHPTTEHPAIRSSVNWARLGGAQAPVGVAAVAAHVAGGGPVGGVPKEAVGKRRVCYLT